MRKTAFIAIVGKANVGKSSILNNLLGQKVAIVSSKPQTTRTRITGILTDGENQYVFTDTPGLHKPKTLLGEYMMKGVGLAVDSVDSIVYLVDGSKPVLDEANKKIMEQIVATKKKVILAINKIDMLSKKEELMERILELSKLCDFTAVVPVSAQNGDGLDSLKDELNKLAIESEFFFPEDTLTDQPERVLASEMIREKLLYRLNEEIPHGIAVSIEKMRERDDSDILDIEAIIYCERDSHKGIIIGKGGSMLKAVSTSARKDLEEFFDCRVNLQCWVKVKEGWRNREGLIHNFGLDQ